MSTNNPPSLPDVSPYTSSDEDHQGLEFNPLEDAGGMSDVMVSDQLAYKSYRGGFSAAQVAEYLRSPIGRPIMLSFFYGNPFVSAPQLEHIKFTCPVSKNFFDKNISTRQSEIQNDKQDGHDNDSTSQAKELACLAGRCDSELLRSFPNKCVACGKPNALDVAHQPLCFSYCGYTRLANGAKMRGMMTYIAKLVKQLDDEQKIQAAIGVASRSPNPHIHFLSAPVCVRNRECRQKAEWRLTKLAQLAKRPPPVPDETHRESCVFKNKKSDLKNKEESIKSDKWEDADQEFGATIQPVIDTPGRVPLRVAVFCGKPIINTKVTTSRNLLSVMVFTLRWDANELATATGDDGRFYSLLGAFLETRILCAAEFRCCICQDRKLATSLIHRPISFRRNNTTGAGAAETRKLIMQLVQLVGDGCQWTAPETEAVLGSPGVWHVNVFVAPICRRDSVVCEETARIAAKRFVDNQIASVGTPKRAPFKLAWPNLFYDFALSNMYTVQNDGKVPKLAVKKIGLGVMDDPKIKSKAVKEMRRTLERLRVKVESDYNAHLQETETKKQMEDECKRGRSHSILRDEDFVFLFALNSFPNEVSNDENKHNEHEDEGNKRGSDPKSFGDGEEVLLSPEVLNLRDEVGKFVKDRYGEDFLANAMDGEI
ncbi:predicted protein [Uncinocarpus reesii 1704]|uniref:Uncharacterized protein n=1 Tax=Uncinocarpus reesii (strain UAMH 1704) TaxID=336963 RepID=C4JE00_UNCRE|nr:uncharacterized protein UREG_00424 [Uncinocarpus reesii 1704]EEP75578.1 predicted protein [Uncinocarpus reesii 1704]